MVFWNFFKCLQEYFFPIAPIVLGQGGVYCALDDVWLEQAAGYFMLDLVSSNRESPTIKLLLSGSKQNLDSGLSAKVKLEGLKLAGDNGKGVPKLQFDSVSVTLVIKATIHLSFNLLSEKWEAKRFQIQIMSFKGPYGISKGYVMPMQSLSLLACLLLFVCLFLCLFLCLFSIHLFSFLSNYFVITIFKFMYCTVF